MRFKAISGFIYFVCAMILINCGKVDPLQSKTRWEGKCTQQGFEPYAMIMHVNERDGVNIAGVLQWTLVPSKTRFRGTVIDNDLSFTEYELIEGGGIALPTFYLGKLDGSTIKGTWIFSRTGPVATGNFWLKQLE